MRHIVTFVCLLAAIAAYAIGWGAGVTGFVIIGIILEVVFWFRL